MAEIAPRGGIDAHHVSAHRRVGGIKGQNLLLGVGQLKAGGKNNLDELLNVGALVLTHQPDSLHREGTSTAHYPARFQVLNQCPSNSQRVYSRVALKEPVFKCYDAGRVLFGYTLHGWKTPLPVGGDTGTQQLVVPVGHQRAIRRVEQRLGQGKEIPHQQNEQEGEHDLSTSAPCAHSFSPRFQAQGRILS